MGGYQVCVERGLLPGMAATDASPSITCDEASM